MRLMSTKYATALIEHKGGAVQEYDPLSYTLAWDGDMSDYPDDFLAEISRGYWENALTEESGSDSDDKLLGMHDMFDTIVEDSSTLKMYSPSTFKYSKSACNVIPLPENNNSAPIYFETTSNPNDLIKDRYNYKTDSFIMYFAPKIPDVAVDLNITINETSTTKLRPNGRIIIGNANVIYYVELFYKDWDQKKNDITVTSPTIPQDRIIKSQFTDNAAIHITAPNNDPKYEFSPSDLNDLSISVKGIILGATGKTSDPTMFQNSLLMQYEVENRTISGWGTSGIDIKSLQDLNHTRRVTFTATNSVVPKDHIRMKYGKLIDLNVASSTTTIVKGDRPTDLVAGDMVVRLDFEPATGSSYEVGSKWDCYLKHEDLMKLMPSVVLINPTANPDGSHDEKSAEIAEIINWHNCRYTLRGVTTDQLTLWDVVLRVKNTTDTRFLTKMDSRLGVAMAADAF